jgi:hypothetical protein
VEAGGVGIFRAIENTELIDFARRSKRLILENCGPTGTYLERGFPFSFIKLQELLLLGKSL